MTQKFPDYTENGIKGDLTKESSPLRDFHWQSSLAADQQTEVDAKGTTTGGIYRTNRSDTRIEINNIDNALYVYQDGVIRVVLSTGQASFYDATGGLQSQIFSDTAGLLLEAVAGNIFIAGGNLLPAIDGGPEIGADDARFSGGYFEQLSIETTGTESAGIGAGNVDPEGAVAAPVGSLWLRTDGGAGTTLYVKESGSGTTGWDAK